MTGDRRKSIFGGLLLLALFAAVFYASWIYFKPKAPEPGPFGALAMSDDTGSFGAAWGFSSPHQRQTALVAGMSAFRRPKLRRQKQPQRQLRLAGHQRPGPPLL